MTSALCLGTWAQSTTYVFPFLTKEAEKYYKFRFFFIRPIILFLIILALILMLFEDIIIINSLSLVGFLNFSGCLINISFFDDLGTILQDTADNTVSRVCLYNFL